VEFEVIALQHAEFSAFEIAAFSIFGAHNFCSRSTVKPYINTQKITHTP